MKNMVNYDSVSGTPYHALPIKDLYPLLNSSAQGLTTEKAEEQRLRYGRNDISSKKKQSPIIQF